MGSMWHWVAEEMQKCHDSNASHAQGICRLYLAVREAILSEPVSNAGVYLHQLESITWKLRGAIAVEADEYMLQLLKDIPATKARLYGYHIPDFYGLFFPQ